MPAGQLYVKSLKTIVGKVVFIRIIYLNTYYLSFKRCFKFIFENMAKTRMNCYNSGSKKLEYTASTLVSNGNAFLKNSLNKSIAKSLNVNLVIN